MTLSAGRPSDVDAPLADHVSPAGDLRGNGPRQCKREAPNVEPTAKKLIVVKSTNRSMGNFGPIAKQVIYVESDGPLRRDYRKIPYTKVQRPIWPLDQETRPGLLV